MQKHKVFIADIVSSKADKIELDARMQELENLVTTYEGFVVVKKVQNRSEPDHQTYIGKGKLEEIKNEMQAFGADILVIGNILKPKQVYNLQEQFREKHEAQNETKVQVWDRIDLILKIFEKHAKTPEAKLQIELAALEHMGPRIFGMGMEMSRQGGGIGTRGKGETNTEIMKRHIRKEKDHIKKELKKHENVRRLQRKHREKRGLATIGIVGYTNAGKSTLLNALTSKGTYEANKLFATLSTSVGKLFLGHEITDKGEYIPKEVLLSDTIGFIRDLPPQLIEAFTSTLEDSIEADYLLHVIDASDPEVHTKIRVVHETLEEIGVCDPKRIINVFNKSDFLSALHKKELAASCKHLSPHFASAHSGEGLEDLKKHIDTLM